MFKISKTNRDLTFPTPLTKSESYLSRFTFHPVFFIPFPSSFFFLL